MTRPAGANAWETFRNIIRINPNDQRAYAGLQTIAGRLETIANAQRNRGNLRESLLTAEEGLGVLPTHVGLRAMHRDLNQRIAAQPQHPTRVSPAAKLYGSSSAANSAAVRNYRRELPIEMCAKRIVRF